MRLLETHPVIVSAFYASTFVVMAYATTKVAELTQLAVVIFILLALPTVLFMWWLYCLRCAALNALRERVTQSEIGDGRLSFGVATVASLALPIVMAFSGRSWSQPGQHFMFLEALLVIAVLSTLISIWAASSALVKFEERQLNVPRGRIIGTFLLVMYLPVGIWFLWPRLQSLLRG